jgi:hypothetical protein
VTRKILIVGLMVLAVLVPLAIPDVPVLLELPVIIADLPFAVDCLAPSVALGGVALLRGPPSR